MSGLATWLAAQRIRRVVFIAGLFPLPGLGLLSAATVVMAAELRGPREALIDCLLALLLLGLMGLAVGMDVPLVAASAAISWLVWIGLGTLGRSSLTLAAQAGVLLALLGLVLFLVLVMAGLPDYSTYCPNCCCEQSWVLPYSWSLSIFACRDCSRRSTLCQRRRSSSLALC